MALINGIYVFVEQEDLRRDIEATTHPVETGIEIESTIRKKPAELSISGKIVNVDNKTASEILSKLIDLQKKGSLINYVGRNTAKNMQIQSFNTSHTNKVSGGADFDMELKEVRIAKSAYNTNKSSDKAKEKKNEPDLSIGAIVVFTGGYVYVSSDAKNPAAKRGRSTCKIFNINKRSWALHQYALISTDGRLVHGWVDKANIEGVASDETASKTNGGTQQAQNGNGEKVYHTVKKGDTIWYLVNTTYKQYNPSITEIIENNPHAFSKPGDARTLQIGSKLFIAYK